MPETGHTLDANTFALWRFDENHAYTDIRAVQDLGWRGDTLSTSAKSPRIIEAEDGTSDYAQYIIADQYWQTVGIGGDNPVDQALRGDWTLEAWVRVDDLSVSRMLLKRMQPSAGGQDYSVSARVNVLTSGRLQVQWGENPSLVITINQDPASAGLTANAWHHIAVRKTWDGSTATVSFFVNGVKRGADQTTSTNAPTLSDSGRNAWYLGGGGAADRGWTADKWLGAVKDVMVSNVARSDAHIAASAAAASKRHTADANSMNHWQFLRAPHFFDAKNNGYHLSEFRDDPLIGAFSTPGIIADGGNAIRLPAGSGSSGETAIRSSKNQDLDALLLGEWTIEFWVRAYQTSENGNWNIQYGNSDIRSAGTSKHAFHIFGSYSGNTNDNGGTGTLGFLTTDSNGDSVVFITATGQLVYTQSDDSSRHHVAIRKRLVGASAYQYDVFADGVNKGTSALVPNTIIPDFAYFSINSINVATIDDFRISSVARTDEEIETSFTSGGGVLPTEPTAQDNFYERDANTVVLYRFDEPKNSDPTRSWTDGDRYMFRNPDNQRGTGPKIVASQDGLSFARRFGDTSLGYLFIDQNVNFGNRLDSALVQGFHGTLTAEAWVYLPSMPSGTTYPVVSCSGSGTGEGNNTQLVVEIFPSGMVGAFWQYGSRTNFSTVQSAGVGVTAGSWTHVAVTRLVGATTTVQFYINGVLQDTKTGLQNPTGGTSYTEMRVHLGSNGFSNYMRGIIKDVHISKVVRDAAWISASAAKADQLHSTDSNTHVRMPLNENSDLADASGNGHHLVITPITIPQITPGLVKTIDRSKVYSHGANSEAKGEANSALTNRLRGEWTLEVWLDRHPHAVNADQNYPMDVCQWGTGIGADDTNSRLNLAFWLRIHAGGSLELLWEKDSGVNVTDFTAATPMASGGFRKYHNLTYIAIRKRLNPSTGRYILDWYVDGTFLESSAEMDNFTGGEDSYMIVAPYTPDSNAAFKGALALIRVSDRLIAASEINSNWLKGTGGAARKRLEYFNAGLN